MPRLLTIDMLQPRAVEVGATGIRQLAQEIRTLLATCKGSVPLDRDFGVSWNVIDSPLPEARQLLISEVAAQLEKYIPRIQFKGIEFLDPGIENSVEGQMPYRVTVAIREEFLDEFR